MSRLTITLNILEWESDRLTYIQKIIPAERISEKKNSFGWCIIIMVFSVKPKLYHVTSSTYHFTIFELVYGRMPPPKNEADP